MSDHKTIELSLDAAQELLPILEARMESLFQKAEDAASDYKRAEKTLAELRLKINGNALPGIEPERKRKRKGEAEKSIADLLASGGGFTIQEIVKRTSTPYSSVFRILKKKNKGRFIEEGDLWKAIRK